MAYLLIDGYNLIGIAHSDLETGRNSLIEKLRKYSELRGHDITVVFDGWKNGRPEENRHRSGSITVIYSRLGEKADSVIKRILTDAVKPWIVISSDREISDFALSKNSVPITADEFESRLCACLRESTDEDADRAHHMNDDNETDRPVPRRKGNPRKRSKKLMQKIRALRKL